MIKKDVWINDNMLEAFDYQEQKITNEPTGNELLKVEFGVSIIGNNNKEKLAEILKDNFMFKIPSEGIEFKARKENSSWSYSGQVLDESTAIKYSIELIELDKDLPEDHQPMATLGSIALMNWIRTRAISELLIDKGLFTQVEYEAKINNVVDRDFENIRKLLAYGIPEPEKSKE